MRVSTETFAGTDCDEVPHLELLPVSEESLIDGLLCLDESVMEVPLPDEISAAALGAPIVITIDSNFEAAAIGAETTDPHEGTVIRRRGHRLLSKLPLESFLPLVHLMSIDGGDQLMLPHAGVTADGKLLTFRA